MHHLSIDLETYSSVPLAKAGAQKYIQSPDFEILLFAFSVDGAPVQIIDLARGERLPPWLVQAITSPEYIKHAYNAPFEWGCLSKYMGTLPPDQWRCTMFHGLYCGYTAGLDATGKALGLPQDKQKLNTGKALIRYFCVPCKPSKANGQRSRNLPQHDPAKWELFKTYCKQDVVTEMEIEKRLSAFPVPDWVQKQWETDLIINARGVAVDLELVTGALSLGDTVRQTLMAEAMQLSGLSNPNSVAQLTTWLQEEIGEELADLRKDTVARLLGRDDNSPQVSRMLEIRQELGKTSTKKYDAIEAAVCEDGRVRGLLQFYGANRTGRWAGRLVQVQNLPRTYTEPLDLARELVKGRKLDALRLIYGSVPDTLSQLIRTAFVAPEGHVLIDADFSAIEARVISWLAKEQWRLEVFRTHGKIYQWTRSPYTNSADYAWGLSSDGNIYSNGCTYTHGSRPAFTLPSSLYVSDDGSVFQNTAPSTPASISVPSSIDGGSTITVSWGTSTDAEGNLEGYIVERQVDGGSWSQIYQGTATSTTNTVAFGTNTVAYRVKAYDAAGLESGWKTSSTVTVTNNRAPGAPGSLTVPAVVRGGGNLAISWTAASDSDGNLSGYELERQVDGGSWTQIYKGSALAYTDTITAGWNTVAYRVRSYDSYNATSTYVTSETRTVDNNAIPVITSSTTSGTDLGTKEDGFDLTYTVTDADSDTVTVKEYLDNVLKRTYTATLGQSNTVQCVTAANWQKVLNGAHTIKVVANDTKADSAPYTVTFTKAVYEASITLAEPMDADDAITVMVLNVLGSIPADADLEVLVTNNANDTEPVWEDATQDVKNGNNHVFTNQTAANGFAFNFKVNVGRGTSNTGGYITSIGGAFQ